MTESEIQAEWNYRFWERIGILVADGEPDKDQRAIAYREANEWALAQEADKP